MSRFITDWGYPGIFLVVILGNVGMRWVLEAGHVLVAEQLSGGLGSRLVRTV